MKNQLNSDILNIYKKLRKNAANAAFDEKTRKFLRQKFDYDDQKEIIPNVLLVDYYEDGTRNLYTCYYKSSDDIGY